ncbi:MAG: 50S ribosomal protein L7/L12 [Saprospiraceae bacterium]|nr:50S ribosomal protein L7/L12 [Saprospiraceae bacterium]
MVDVSALAEQLVNLTVKEVNELASVLKDQYGIEPAAAAVAVAAAPAADGGAAVVEQTEFEVILKSGGPNKLNVIKEVKNILNLGLKETKDLIDRTPSSVKSGVSKEEANSLREALTAAGAEIEIK